MFTKKLHKGATTLYDEFSRQETSTVKRAFFITWFHYTILLLTYIFGNLKAPRFVSKGF